MRTLYLSLALFILAPPLFAQEKAAVANHNTQTILTIEAGITSMGHGMFGNHHATSRSLALASPWDLTHNPAFVAHLSRRNAGGWGWGGRLEISKWSLQTYPDFRSYTGNPGLIDVIPTGRVVSPVVSLAPQISKTFMRGKNALTIALYAGGAFGWSNQRITLLGTGGNTTESKFLAGLQGGLDVSFYRQLNERWSAGATLGFQQNYAQFHNAPFWLHFKNLPATLGVGYNL